MPCPGAVTSQLLGELSGKREEVSGPDVEKRKPPCPGDGHALGAVTRENGEGNGNPLLFSCLENPTDRGAWQATDHGVAKSRTRLSN